MHWIANENGVAEENDAVKGVDTLIPSRALMRQMKSGKYIYKRYISEIGDRITLSSKRIFGRFDRRSAVIQRQKRRISIKAGVETNDGA